MTTPAEQWSLHTRNTLKRYDEALLRQVAHKLCKPRNQWPVEELLERVTAALGNLAMIDRRLKNLPIECRRILAVIAHSRQPRWPVGSLVEILIALGASDGLAPIVTLLESGLLLPELFPLGADPDSDKLTTRGRLRSFTTWLARAESRPVLLAAPTVTHRLLGIDLGISIRGQEAEGAALHEADGLDWPLCVAVLWQQLLDAPLRRTQQGDYFKRDHERLMSDALLGTSPNDALAPVRDAGFLTAALASSVGLARPADTELHAGVWPASFKASLPQLLAELWIAFLGSLAWNPADGHTPGAGPGHPYASAYVLALLLLARLGDKKWAMPADIEKWIIAHHPFWRSNVAPAPGLADFLLGVAYSLRLVQAAKGPADAWLVRLSPLGRWMLGLADESAALPSFKQTLLVQPNLEILAYRQGLTPELIANLSKIATWKSLGPACTLQLEPHSVYRALEMGETLTSLVQLLEAHSMKALPTTVLDSLKTWSSKRERLSVYAAGAIFEFASSADMNEALARGLPAVRLTDKLAIVANESAIDYKHFRLTGTRDYTLPPERCVEVAADGVTLSIDLARSDLLLETELQRFAEAAQANVHDAQALRSGAANRCSYRLTPGSIAAARTRGVTLSFLETWFSQRTGLPMSAAALLLITGAAAPPIELRRQLVLHVASEPLADGLAQWPATRDFLRGRLGPTTVVVEEKDVPALLAHLHEIGMRILFEG